MRKNMWIQIVAYVLLAVVIGATAFGFLWLSDYFGQKPAPYFVKINGKLYNKGVALVSNGDIHVSIYTSSNLFNKQVPYTVEIVPNVDKTNDFDYLVDGEFVQYSSVGDLSKTFALDHVDNKVTFKGIATLEECLESYYGADVTLQEGLSNRAFYTLVIVNADGYEMRFDLRFDIPDLSVPVDSIEVDPGGILF